MVQVNASFHIHQFGLIYFFFFLHGSDDLTLNIWDSSADLSSANDDDSAKWYTLESSALSHGILV